MEDSIEVILQEDTFSRSPTGSQDSPTLTALTGALLTGGYWVWRLFMLPGARKIPIGLKVPYLPSSTAQILSVMKLLEGRTGRLADLGSGDGRLCTGYEINSMLLAFSRCKAYWTGVPASQANFVNKDFWKIEMLGEKLLRELADDAHVVACRFPFSQWHSHASSGSGLDQAWAYDINTVRLKLNQRGQV
ncbi:ATP synthase subunit C lysine N-methyltransferase isoform X4 [Hypomesus transpacificus]|uniref:ATP synthase subunit C lysine N-methyltransferase isoform X4 n=1 Tax=Hypomesus transpacificus TaxID=137520 RepID=UPI001F0782A0|nr:ATP synthase subunit C lysine N-methyltransferase isoform X4 [Hypomesus transpacificus]XP_046904488.1 ATP synthase subunit C lysine N-methyltransferase isoform X4 [Hypomesus transpacificus]